jgi:hypothetical protein
MQPETPTIPDFRSDGYLPDGLYLASFSGTREADKRRNRLVEVKL